MLHFLWHFYYHLKPTSFRGGRTFFVGKRSDFFFFFFGGGGVWSNWNWKRREKTALLGFGRFEYYNRYWQSFHAQCNCNAWAYKPTFCQPGKVQSNTLQLQCVTRQLFAGLESTHVLLTLYSGHHQTRHFECKL